MGSDCSVCYDRGWVPCGSCDIYVSSSHVGNWERRTNCSGYDCNRRKVCPARCKNALEWEKSC
jgi:hypothetical protein